MGKIREILKKLRCNLEEAYSFDDDVDKSYEAEERAFDTAEAEIKGLVDKATIAKMINDITDNQLIPYVIVSFKDGHGSSESFGKYFGKVIKQWWDNQ